MPRGAARLALKAEGLPLDTLGKDRLDFALGRSGNFSSED
jgi:hypothetical protein